MDWFLYDNGLCHERVKLNQNFQKNKLVTRQTPFFVIGPFFTPHSICFKIGI